MNIETLDVSLIKPYEKNAKKHDNKQINLVAESIKRFGFVQPLVIDKDNVLVIGHCRLESAKKLGITSVPVLRMDDLSSDEVKALRLADNKLNESAWDMKLAQEDLRDLSNDLFEITGFDKEVLVVESPKDDDVPENVPSVSVLGDVYQLGRHRVLCGDATKLEDMEKLMGEEKAQMVFTDPPYNVDYSGGMGGDGNKHKRSKILNDKMSAEHFYTFLYDSLSNMIAFTKGAFYICMSSSELHNLWKAFTDGGGHWQSYIIWAKDNFTLSRSDYQHQFEPIMYGVTESLGEKMEKAPEETDGEAIMYGWTAHDWYGGRKQGNVWTYPRPKSSKEHPTMKPVMLCVKAICNSSRQDQIVLDSFLGSGSTLIACEKSGRICYGMELDPHYVDVIVARWEKFTGEKATKL